MNLDEAICESHTIAARSHLIVPPRVGKLAYRRTLFLTVRFVLFDFGLADAVNRTSRFALNPDFNSQLDGRHLVCKELSKVNILRLQVHAIIVLRFHENWTIRVYTATVNAHACMKPGLSLLCCQAPVIALHSRLVWLNVEPLLLGMALTS